jgi:crotonobetainyl-CoA:carnitine CoA-transferase CaiB-like acyl-CoA transferase
VPLADGRQIEVLRHPVNFSKTPATVRSGPASPGGDTAQVKAEMASRQLG